MGDTASKLPDSQATFALPFTLGNDDTANAECVIAPRATLKGDLSCQAEIRVLGTVEGELTSSTRVVVVAGAEIRGRITSPEIVVSGLVIGELLASRQLAIRAGGEVRGTVNAGALDLEQGGTLAARCSIVEPLAQPS